jgi:hypothetical protein
MTASSTILLLTAIALAVYLLVVIIKFGPRVNALVLNLALDKDGTMNAYIPRER